LNKEKKQIDKNSKTSLAEPYSYMSLFLRGTEKQCLKLLNYVNNRNGARIIYQCKSLTKLKVTRDDQAQPQAVAADTVEMEAQRGSK